MRVDILRADPAGDQRPTETDEAQLDQATDVGVSVTAGNGNAIS